MTTFQQSAELNHKKMQKNMFLVHEEASYAFMLYLYACDINFAF